MSIILYSVVGLVLCSLTYVLYKSFRPNKNMITLRLRTEVYDPTNKMSAIGRMYFSPEKFAELTNVGLDPNTVMDVTHNSMDTASPCHEKLKHHGQVAGVFICPGDTLVFCPGSDTDILGVFNSRGVFLRLPSQLKEYEEALK